MQDHFILIVSEFMYIPWNHAQKIASNRSAAVADGDLSTQSVTIGVAEAFELLVAEYLKEQVWANFNF